MLVKEIIFASIIVASYSFPDRNQWEKRIKPADERSELRREITQDLTYQRRFMKLSPAEKPAYHERNDVSNNSPKNKEYLKSALNDGKKKNKKTKKLIGSPHTVRKDGFYKLEVELYARAMYGDGTYKFVPVVFDVYGKSNLMKEENDE